MSSGDVRYMRVVVRQITRKCVSVGGLYIQAVGVTLGGV
jgi:hypothetical protein